jgi:hypothetical protein
VFDRPSEVTSNHIKLNNTQKTPPICYEVCGSSELETSKLCWRKRCDFLSYNHNSHYPFHLVIMKFWVQVRKPMQFSVWNVHEGAPSPVSDVGHTWLLESHWIIFWTCDVFTYCTAS